MAHTLKNTLSTFRLGSKLALLVAVLGIAGTLGMASPVSAQNNNNNVPQTRDDCRDWRDYGNRFDNRGECVRFVSANDNANHGYGGNGNGGGNGGGNQGGNLGSFITQLFAFLNNFFAALFNLFGRIF